MIIPYLQYGETVVHNASKFFKFGSSYERKNTESGSCAYDALAQALEV